MEAGGGECTGRSYREAKVTSTETTEVTTASHGVPGRVSHNRAGYSWCWTLAKEWKDQHFLEQESTDS